MGNLLGNSNLKPQSTLVTGGGAGAPWNWGVSPFDQSSIDAATSENVAAMGNRYNQLGLGGSTMQGQDAAQAAQAGTAMTGQLQTQDVANPALNPALQPQINSIIGAIGSSGTTLSDLASAAGTGAGLSGALGGALGAGAGAGAGAGGTTAVLGSDAIDAAAASFFL